MKIDEHEFEQLYKQWQKETQFVSDPSVIASNLNCLKIAAMGKDALYLIFRKMRKEPSIGWFQILHDLTGADPIKDNDCGNIVMMTQSWLQWAFDNGYDESITHVPGYHLVPIGKGRLGEISKMQEELDELSDAEEQDCKILQMVELSDLYGAMEAYAERLGTNMEEIRKMSSITKRAFDNGRRKAS